MYTYIYRHGHVFNSALDHSKANNLKRFTDLLGSVFDSEDHSDGKHLPIIIFVCSLEV